MTRAAAGYSIDEICEKGALPRRTFFDKRKRGDLPFLEEILPRIRKRHPLYRADLVDAYFANQNRDAAHDHARIR